MATEASSFKLYRYDPSIGAAVVFVLLFVVGSCIHTYQVARTRTWFFVPFVLGGYCKSSQFLHMICFKGSFGV